MDTTISAPLMPPARVPDSTPVGQGLPLQPDSLSVPEPNWRFASTQKQMRQGPGGLVSKSTAQRQALIVGELRRRRPGPDRDTRTQPRVVTAIGGALALE